MLWDPALNVDVLFHDQWIIHLQINEDSSTWFLSGIYGNAKASIRKYQWQTLPLIAPPPNLPWLCMGDFNDILYREEKRGGKPVGNQESKHFMEMVNMCGLIDLGFNGPIYTWCNNQQGRNRVLKRINRFLANAQWRVLHPNAKVFHKPNLESDHKIFLLHLNSAQLKLRRPFRFEVMWLSDPTCKSVIHNAMNNHVVGSPSFRLCKLLAKCRQSLIHWNHHHFGNINSRIKDINQQISNHQAYIAGKLYPEEADIQYEHNLLTQYNELLKIQEKHWFQKVKNDSILHGNLNTSYFHTMVVRRRHKAFIGKIRGSNGTMVTNKDDIGNTFVNFFLI
ncbi:hypothetical protein IFM89_027059 [Coptis chinensis]|uniref:Uncharacterized protein n=1 Tax=Coptis chinensis TaxID=261450 RepID=A0A835HXJ4_9MAGN|nr:hypothetical protein IFM89_027059 [Coptis chinensis]